MTHPFIIERNQLLSKIIDLQDLLEQSIMLRAMGSDEVDDMLDQLKAMEDYSEALSRRILRRLYEHDGAF